LSESIEDCEYRPGAGAALFTTVTEDDIAAVCKERTGRTSRTERTRGGDEKIVNGVFEEGEREERQQGGSLVGGFNACQ
jgi:hypothetical protein